jgi:hypothetical protein
MSIHRQIRERVVADLALPAQDEHVQLNNGLRTLSKWRTLLIQNTMLKHQGTRVNEGVFEGLDFLTASAEGCHVPKLLGCYEQPLQRHIEEAIHAGYSTILNIGCAEGYYAVGLARRVADANIHAYDIDPKAREICAELAIKNGVRERVSIGELFRPEDFTDYLGRRVLVLCDIEGAEKELLDLSRAPALSGMDIIVESHECLVPGMTRMLMDRFASTHDITLVEDNGQRLLDNAPGWFSSLAHLDQLLAVWEWRSGPTPWLVMKVKAQNQQ